jgi:hypothetical protein
LFGGWTNTTPLSALVNAMSTARLPLGLLLESVPGTAVWRENVCASAVR